MEKLEKLLWLKLYLLLLYYDYKLKAPAICITLSV